MRGEKNKVFIMYKFLVMMTLTIPTSTMAGDYLREDESVDRADIVFDYGMPCSSLVDLSHSEVLAITHPSHREHFEAFCAPENVYTCSDYSSLLYKQGALERQDELYCRFVPKTSAGP